MSNNSTPHCLNCDTELRGQYCANCGQRSTTRLISLWQLLKEAFGDLLEFDSRLWRTLIPLVRRPGRLTLDYLQGRRARYMPPFRMYLVLSVIFFVVASFDARQDFGLLFEPQPEPTAEDVAATLANTNAEKEETRRILRDLKEEGTIPDSVIAELDDTDGFNIQIGDDINIGDNGDKCDFNEEDLAVLPGWLEKRLTVERMKRACERLQIDSGKSFLAGLWDNIPLALIVLLPLMALVLKILYPLSRRYFVEHLLFFVHFHAFFFLLLTLQILLIRGSSLLPIPDAIPILIVVASSFYIPVYLFVALRRVYAQGRLATFAKYIVLIASYVTGASLMLLATVLLALNSVVE